MIWHAYTVAAPAFSRYHEWSVIDDLRALGGDAFTPYEIRWVRARGVKGTKQRRYPLYPGYVFAGFTAAPWTDLMDIKHLMGVLQFAGEPARLSKRDLTIARQMTGAPVENRYKGAFRAGDKARIASGPFRDWVAKIAAIVDGKAVIPVHVFGSIREIRIELDKLEAA